MIFRSVVVLIIAVSVALITNVETTYASSLKVAPDSFTAKLKSGEKQKGFIDISNPTEDTVVVKTNVEAFRQIDNKGSLEFYDDDQLEKGVQLDLKQFKLGPHDMIRMYFLLDGKKLPSGDVFGAVFFTASQSDKIASGVNQAVRVGTLLSIVNGTPGPREAKITALQIPFFQTGSTIRGSVAIKNTATSDKNTGFYPDVGMKLWPGKRSQVITTSLLFAGRTRSTDFELKNTGLGLHRVSASYDGSTKTAWVITADPFTVVITGVIVGTIALESALWLRRRSRLNRQRR